MRRGYPLCLIGVLLTLGPLTARAQHPAPAVLSAILTAFLADSGARIRGLAWSAGNDTPIRWASAAPVPNPDSWMRKPGLTLARIGTAKAMVGGKERGLNVRVYGNATGIQRVSVSFPYDGNFEGGDIRDTVAIQLKGGGLTLTPLKCDRKTEGYTYGNLVYVAKAPGKLASALWWTWNCAADGSCGFDQTIIYRKAELAEVECVGT